MLPLMKLEEKCSHFDISSDEKYVLTHSAESGLIKLWEISSQNSIQESRLKFANFKSSFAPSALRFLADSRQFAVWSREEQSLQMHEISTTARRLLWNKPPRLELDDVQATNVIADPLAHALLNP
jgi:hypothetical protein